MSYKITTDIITVTGVKSVKFLAWTEVLIIFILKMKQEEWLRN